MAFLSALWSTGFHPLAQDMAIADGYHVSYLTDEMQREEVDATWFGWVVG